MMEVEDGYCNLKCDQFRSHISTGLQELRNSNIFFDVTLACDTGQVGAHKAVLSACSSFFRNILVTYHHHHPLVYLKGVTMEEIMKILDFMYCGEVSVRQDLLSSFLATAKELKVVGFQNHDKNMLIIGSSLEPLPYPPGTVSCAENTEGDNSQIMGLERSGQNVQKESYGQNVQKGSYGQNVHEEGNGQNVQEEGYGPMTESYDKLIQDEEDNTGLAQMIDNFDKIAGNIHGPHTVAGSCSFEESVQENRLGHALVDEFENNTVHEGDVSGKENLETSQWSPAREFQYRSQLKKAVVRLPRNSVNIRLTKAQGCNVQGIIDASGDYAMKGEITEHNSVAEIGGTDTQGENSNPGSGYVAGSSEKTDQEADSSRKILRKRKSKTKAEIKIKSSSTIKSKTVCIKNRKTNARPELDSGIVQGVPVSPCSLKSGPIAGSLKSRTKNIVEYVERRDDDLSSNSSHKSGLVFHGPLKKTQFPRQCTICGEQFIRLERHILLAHKSKPRNTRVASDSDGRIYFSIATKELSEDGEAIEDLPCGMKPETTVKKIKKSYCKRVGWERDKTRLQLEGKYLWEGQTVGGFEGVTIVAVKIG